MITNKIKTLKLGKSLLPVQNKNINNLKQNRVEVNPSHRDSLLLNVNTSTSLPTKSFNKYLNLTNYSQNLFSSNLRKDTNQLILNTKKEKDTTQTNLLQKETINSQTPLILDGPAPLILESLSSKATDGAIQGIAEQSGRVVTKGYKHFDKIDMLDYSKVKKLRNRIKKTKLALSLAPSRVNTILTNYLGFGPNTTKMNLDICRSQNLIYNFNNTKPQVYKLLSTILENSFITMFSLISKPFFNITPHKVVISLFFFLITKTKKNKSLKKSSFIFSPNYIKSDMRDNRSGGQMKSKFLSLNSKNFELLCANLSKYLKKPVEIDLIRLYSPINDSNILANVLGRISDISYKPYIYILDTIFNQADIKNPITRLPNPNSVVPSLITGIKIRLAGRLLKNKIIPRYTVKTTQHGSLTRSSAEIVSKARFTSKNKRGTFSITTSIGHRFF